MRVDDATIQRIIWEKQLLTKEQIESAVLLAPSLGKSFSDTLVFKNFIPEATLGQAIAESMGVSFIALRDHPIPSDVLGLVPEESAVAHQIVPFGRTDTELFLAMQDPANFEIINLLEKKTGLIVKPYFAFKDHISYGLSQYKNDITAAFQRIMEEVKALGNDLNRIAEEVPTIRMLDTIMEYAIAQTASDIHIEGQERTTLIRFRVDGMLHDTLVLEPFVLPALVARIKYLSNLKIDEHRLPQDGRFTYERVGNRVAVRVSILPSFYGENIVMRVLPETSKTRTLEELGFTPANIALLTEQIKRPNGIILLTGPTGSGKTTTLYSLLEMLNKPEVKIATIEDPIEYSVPRVSQTQVNTTTGLDFAAGLRALLRHDPDIIMVGEIRDSETADISMNASLTGHLVLSTLHTNDATSSVPRLIDLGIEPFLLAATIRVVVAQRLVRQLCSKCATPFTLSSQAYTELARVTGFDVEELQTKTFYNAQGCGDCHDGFRGRIGIHEILIVSDLITDLVMTRPSNDKLRQAATQHGMYTMLQDGIAKAAAGLTTIHEVIREAEKQE